MSTALLTMLVVCDVLWSEAVYAEGVLGTSTNVPPLKDAFKGKFLIGTALNYPALQGRAPLDVEISTRHFNALTAGNSMKPDTLQRTERQFNFRDGDRLVEIAEQNGATPIGHVLVWHEQTPKWFFEARTVSRLVANWL